MSETSRPVDTKGAVIAFNEGAAAAEAGDEKRAVQLWHQALELDPDLIPAARNLITYYQNRNDTARELELWERIVAFDPYETDHLVLQAAALRRAGQHKAALNNYHRAISIYPYFKFWYHELATLYGEIGEHDEAELWRGRGDSLGADEAEICYEDGVRHAGEARWKSARTCFEAVLDEFPANLDARLRLAKVLEQAGTQDEVIGQYNQAMGLTESARGLVYYRLAEYFIKVGRLDDAENAFQSAINEARSFRKADRALQRLQQHRARARAQADADAASVVEDLGATVQDGHDIVHVLDPDDIGMEPVTDPGAPVMRPPDPRLPWTQQLRQVLDQALAVAAPGGQAPRVAIVAEENEELSHTVTTLLAELRAQSRSLRSQQSASDIFVVRPPPMADGALPGPPSSGWLGRDPQAELDASSWGRARPGISLNAVWEAVKRAAGRQGFNCVLFVGFGRCYALDASTPALVADTPLHCVCHVHPSYHYIDFRAAVASRAPNFIEIAV